MQSVSAFINNATQNPFIKWGLIIGLVLVAFMAVHHISKAVTA